jgi:hypothetical protein
LFPAAAADVPCDVLDIATFFARSWYAVRATVSLTKLWGRMMFISVRRYSSVRSVNEVCQKIGSGFVPLLQGSPGFIAYYAIDGGNGTMATISMFSTEDMALESNEKAAKWLKENVADLQPEPAEITSGEVKVRVETR